MADTIPAGIVHSNQDHEIVLDDQSNYLQRMRYTFMRLNDSVIPEESEMYNAHKAGLETLIGSDQDELIDLLARFLVRYNETQLNVDIFIAMLMVDLMQFTGNSSDIIKVFNSALFEGIRGITRFEGYATERVSNICNNICELQGMNADTLGNFSEIQEVLPVFISCLCKS